MCHAWSRAKYHSGSATLRSLRERKSTTYSSSLRESHPWAPPKYTFCGCVDTNRPKSVGGLSIQKFLAICCKKETSIWTDGRPSEAGRHATRNDGLEGEHHPPHLQNARGQLVSHGLPRLSCRLTCACSLSPARPINKYSVS